uniref:Uncharacterized protein n=1 Tax=Tanacetum cinerariifolium TaxID=118510 RepID=A0A6L2L8H9_TANCI|nr:hypothetical protein [Tanacetum cinerariifolium]
MIAPGSSSLELRIHDHNNEPSSSKLVTKVVSPEDKKATSRQELELPFHHHITMLRTSEIYLSIHREDGNPACANIQQALSRMVANFTVIVAEKLYLMTLTRIQLLLVEDMLETLMVSIYDALRTVQVVSPDLESEYNCT